MDRFSEHHIVERSHLWLIGHLHSVTEPPKRRQDIKRILSSFAQALGPVLAEDNGAVSGEQCGGASQHMMLGGLRIELDHSHNADRQV